MKEKSLNTISVFLVNWSVNNLTANYELQRLLTSNETEGQKEMMGMELDVVYYWRCIEQLTL